MKDTKSIISDSGIQGLNGEILFPSLDGVDLSKPGDNAIYLAKMDFYPFHKVMEDNQLALDELSETYSNIHKKANDVGDFFIEEKAMHNLIIHSSRVSLLTYYSLLLTMVSILEEAVNTLCRMHKNMRKLAKDLKDIRGSGLERAAKYLKDVAGIEGFKDDSNWEYITTIRDVRNMVVHNGGRIIKEDVRQKCDKFGIGYREEDYGLYLEYSDLEKFYQAMMEFIERAFRIEPTIN